MCSIKESPINIDFYEYRAGFFEFFQKYILHRTIMAREIQRGNNVTFISFRADKTSFGRIFTR